MSEQSKNDVTFEEVMFTIISATQDVFKSFMNIDLFAGKCEKKLEAIDMHVVAIVGLAGHRVGYVIIGADEKSASAITKAMLMCEEVDQETLRDAFGELANNIAGAFKSKYSEQYGQVKMGLPLVVSGSIIPMPVADAEDGTDDQKSRLLNVRHQQGVIIPFVSIENQMNLRVMVYM